MGKLTLEEIGEMAGVSRSTVSRVVNNQANVRAEVRERVLQVIAETGYQPNLAARSLASNRSNVIGLVIPRIVQSVFTDPYFPRIIQGITQACNTNDYTLSLFLFHTSDEEQKIYPRVLQAGMIDGVIVQVGQKDDPLIAKFIEQNVPLITLGRPHHMPQASYIDVDNVQGAYIAVNHLVRQGRQRIATITGDLMTTAGTDRLEGYKNALNERGHIVEANLIAEGDFSESSGYFAMQKLLPYQPDAVFAAADAMALGALRALRQAGLHVPDDIALVGFDDLPPATIAEPPLTTIRQPIKRLGIMAVETLIDYIENGFMPGQRIVMPTELVLRTSCGRLGTT